MRVCVFLPNWVGDVVMATPALRALRTHVGAGGVVVGLGTPYVAEVLEGTSLLDDFRIHRPEVARRPSGLVAAARALRRGRFDLAVLLPNSFHTALVAWLAGVGERIGYARNRRGPLLTTRLAPLTANGAFVPTPLVGEYLQLVYAIGCGEESWRLELASTPRDEESADDAWAALGLTPGGRVIALNPGGAFGAAKLWPEEYWAVVARHVVGTLDHGVLVLCGPEERERAAAIARLAGDRRVVSLADLPVSIGLTKACVRRSRMLVTTDSGARHFGAAFGVPVVALFGPTHIAWSDTRYTNEQRLQLALDCGPCQQRVCPLQHHRCMRELTPESVIRTVVDLLGEA
jgi:heptosyltransferase-2